MAVRELIHARREQIQRTYAASAGANDALTESLVDELHFLAALETAYQHEFDDIHRMTDLLTSELDTHAIGNIDT